MLFSLYSNRSFTASPDQSMDQDGSSGIAEKTNGGILSNGNHSISSIVDPEQNGGDNGDNGGAEVDERVVDPIILRRNVGQQKRWSCKEELAFYRTLMAIGVKGTEDGDENQFSWDEFRQMSKLDKTDEVLNEYFAAFMAMCKRILGLPLLEKEGIKAIQPNTNFASIFSHISVTI